MEQFKRLIIPEQKIAGKIYLFQDRKVMLDSDLAELYEVPTGVLIQAVKRNPARFPEDFMVQLNKKEFGGLRSQFVISKGRGGRRYLPYVFTEQGIAMLSSVLNSERAVQVNIQIMRTFTKMREYLAVHDDLRRKIEGVEKKFSGKFKKHGRQFAAVFEAIRRLAAPSAKTRRRIGFHPNVEANSRLPKSIRF